MGKLKTAFMIAGLLTIGGAAAAPFVVEGVTFGSALQATAIAGADSAAKIAGAGQLGFTKLAGTMAPAVS